MLVIITIMLLLLRYYYFLSIWYHTHEMLHNYFVIMFKALTVKLDMLINLISKTKPIEKQTIF